MAILMAILPEA